MASETQLARVRAWALRREPRPSAPGWATPPARRTSPRVASMASRIMSQTDKELLSMCSDQPGEIVSQMRAIAGSALSLSRES